MNDPYPTAICADCGNTHGRRPCGTATWHEAACDVCGRTAACTEPRDFGYLRDSWGDKA